MNSAPRYIHIATFSFARDSTLPWARRTRVSFALLLRWNCSCLIAYAIGASVTRRAAVLTHSGESEPFEARLRSITRLYERRSRFVHQGEPVPVDALTEAPTLCEEVAYCLLRLAKAGSAAEWSAEKWQKELDFVASAWEAGKEVQPTDLERLGLELAP